MIEIVYMPEIVEAWPVMKAGVNQIIHKTPEPLPWTQFDLLKDLLNQKAKVFFIFQNQEYAGFFVLQYMEEDHTKAPYIHLWMTYKEPGHEYDYVKTVWDYLEEEGRQQGAKYVRGLSSRPGWARRLNQIGAAPLTTVYQKEL